MLIRLSPERVVWPTRRVLSRSLAGWSVRIVPWVSMGRIMTCVMVVMLVPGVMVVRLRRVGPLLVVSSMSSITVPVGPT